MAMFGLAESPRAARHRRLDAFFDALDHLGDVELLAHEGGLAGRSARRIHEEAWAAVRAVGDRDGLSREIDRVRKRAMAWATRGSNVACRTRSATSATWAQVKLEAEEAIVDAALAIALGDRLDERTRDDVLLGRRGSGAR